MRNILIGIDISAKTLDLCIDRDGNKQFSQIKNDKKDIKKLLKPFIKNQEQVIIGMENTGKYNNMLYTILTDYDFRVFVIHPYHLKKSIGLARGKNDKVDAERIVSFIEKNHKELDPWQPASETITQLKILFTERKAAVKDRTRLKQKKKELDYIQNKTLKASLLKMNDKRLKESTKVIKELERMIREIIASDKKLKKQMKLLQSIPGIGFVVAIALIVKTEGFRIYTDPRKLACCAGVVPFHYQSGTSVFSKAKLSNMADKSLKTLLNMAALAAVKTDNDLKKYYERKVAEGKNKMSVLNAVRNKIIHISYAVINSEKMFENRLQMS